MNARRGQERGFTLVEVLVVLSIVALVSVLALPRLTGSGEVQRFEGQIREIAAGLRYARMEAMRSGQTIQVDIDLQGRSIVLPGKAISLPKTARLEVLTARGLIVPGETASVRFVPQGGSTGGAISIGLERHQARIDISWLTGGVIVRFDEN